MFCLECNQIADSQPFSTRQSCFQEIAQITAANNYYMDNDIQANDFIYYAIGLEVYFTKNIVADIHKKPFRKI